MSGRIARRFAGLKAAGRAGFVAFITAADPTPETSLEILRGLPGAGADLIELGMPFSDPMADGPSVQAASLRALEAGGSMICTLDLVRRFREQDQDTPIVLMGYYNPIHAFGPEAFIAAALDAGVDGLIVVDLPPEEDRELCLPALEAGLDFIRLATPTTDDARLPAVLAHTAGFVYYVSITGITGTSAPDSAAAAQAVARLKRHTELPIVVGFGIRTPAQAARIAAEADGVAVGSALVEQVARAASPQQAIAGVLGLVSTLASAVRNPSSGMARSRPRVPPGTDSHPEAGGSA